MRYKSFGFTDHQLMIRETIIGLMERELPPEKIEALEKASAYPEDAFKVLADEGWLALPYAAEHGGADATYKDMAVFIEALAYVHPGITSAYMTTVIYGGMQLARNGNDWMRSELMPELLAGRLKMAIAMSEPSGGSDLAKIKTRAVADGDDWVLSGQKVYITNAHVADRLVVAAKTDPDAGRHGMSLLLVDTKADGVEIRPMDPLGRRTSLPNEVFFDEVRVSEREVIGQVGEGWKLLMPGLNLERLLLAAASAGQCLKIVELARDWAVEREAFGQKITEFQAISHKFAEMQMMTETARLHSFHVADMLDAGENPVMETAIAKTLATEYNLAVADMAMQVMGGAGYMMGPIARLYADARVGPIGGGSSEIMRNVIAKQILT